MHPTSARIERPFFPACQTREGAAFHEGSDIARTESVFNDVACQDVAVRVEGHALAAIRSQESAGRLRARLCRIGLAGSTAKPPIRS